jgi:serine-aspartate repeat-containing protein C/D/E
MRSRSTITAAFALAAATILAVGACGSSVSGSAAVNTAAAQTLTTTSESSTSTSRTSSTRTTTSEESTSDSTTSEESTETTGTSETELTDLTDLSGLGAFGGACLNVSVTYLAAAVAPFATLAGGSTPYDGSDLQEQLDSLKTEAAIPPEIAGDLQAIEEVAGEANGATLTDAGALFSSEKFTTASDNISKWLDTNCGG